MSVTIVRQVEECLQCFNCKEAKTDDKKYKFYICIQVHRVLPYPELVSGPSHLVDFWNTEIKIPDWCPFIFIKQQEEEAAKPATITVDGIMEALKKLTPGNYTLVVSSNLSKEARIISEWFYFEGPDEYQLSVRVDDSVPSNTWHLV